VKGVGRGATDMGAERPQPSKPIVPALGASWLTGFYDPVIALTLRERKFKTALLRQAGIEAGQRVLDLGCGTGTLALLAKRMQPEAQLTGVDADDRMLSTAIRKTARSGLDIDFNRGNSSRLPYRAASFDVVLSSLFFHHLSPADKEGTLEEVFRVLRPGGALHVADWGKASGALMRCLFYTVQVFDGFENTRDNVAGCLPQMFERGGFRNVKVRREFSTIYGTLALYSADKPCL